MTLDELTRVLHGDDPEEQDRALRELEALGGGAAVAVLAGCLDQGAWRQARGFDPDWRGPHGERLQGRVVYEPLSHLAVRALGRLFPEGPPAPAGPVEDADVELWRTWWGAQPGAVPAHRDRGPAGPPEP